MHLLEARRKIQVREIRRALRELVLDEEKLNPILQEIENSEVRPHSNLIILIRNIEPLKTKMVLLLEKALDEIDCNKHIPSDSAYRYQLIICNFILYLDDTQESIRARKGKLMAAYLNSEFEQAEEYSLKYFVNEVRLTYDVDYLSDRLEKKIDRGEWNEACYCLIIVKLVEPDNENVDRWEEKIRSNLPSNALYFRPMASIPTGKTLVLDTNIVLSLILAKNDAVDSDLDNELGKVMAGNSIIITDSVYEEVKNHIDYEVSRAKDHPRRMADYGVDSPAHLKRKLDGRLERFLLQVPCKITIRKEADMQKIIAMYSRYPRKLVDILNMKLEHIDKYENALRQKLRKIAQRTCLLPEEGDLRLLADLMALNTSNQNDSYALLTDDTDFKHFSTAIRDELGVQVYSLKQ